MTSQNNDCQAFFEHHAQTLDKATPLIASGCALDWEGVSASKHSPGVVSADEHVLRIVINPIHLDPEGSIKPSLWSDVKDKGGSVNRLTHAESSVIVDSARAREAAKNAAIAGVSHRSVYGTVRLSVSEVRQLKVTSQGRAFGVYDTAKEDDHSHADIFQVIQAGGKEARSARLQLFALAELGYQLV